MAYWRIHPETVYEGEPMTDEDRLARLKATLAHGTVCDTQEVARDFEITRFTASLCIGRDRRAREEVCFDYVSEAGGWDVVKN